MLSKNEIYKQAFSVLEARRLKAKKQQAQNIETVLATCPEIDELLKKSKKQLISLMKTTFNQQKEASSKLNIISRIRMINSETQLKVKLLLKKHDFKEDYMEYKPFCCNCNDYGHIRHIYCECFKNIVKKITVSEFQKSFHVKLTCFEDFNLNFYSKRKSEDSKLSDYEQMKYIFSICEDFANKFPKVHCGLIMFGKTGIGKTHLSMAIASTIMSKNFTVIYATAQELIRKIANCEFTRNQNSDLNFSSLLFDSDLVIVDDLGTENTSEFTQMALFELINRRTMFRKPIILNSNLTLEEISTRYDIRIYSRIRANLIPLAFVGTDNRPKLLNNNPNY